MNKRIALLLVILVLTMVFAAKAQTNFTVKTYIATSTSASESTVTTKRRNYEGFGDLTMKQLDLSSSTATVTVTITQAPTEVDVARRITETAVGSSAVATGVLYTYWDTTTELLTQLYRDATGTLHTVLPSSSTADLLVHAVDQSTHGCATVASIASVLNPTQQVVTMSAIATPSLATGVMFFDASDHHLKISRDGATWTILSD